MAMKSFLGVLGEVEKSFLGYDKILNELNKYGGDFQVPNWPPFNIKKVDENRYVIELAVAGFGTQDVSVTLEDGVLKVSGVMKSGTDNFLYKGIAERSFQRAFNLADTIEIKDAEMINGLLKIFLENIIPENKKPRKIDIRGEGSPSTSKSQLLNE